MARKLTSGTRRCGYCDKWATRRIKHGEYYCEAHYLEVAEQRPGENLEEGEEHA